MQQTLLVWHCSPNLQVHFSSNHTGYSPAPMLNRVGVLICCLFCLLTSPSVAQNGPTLPLDDPALWHFNALLARGYLSDLDAGNFPLSEYAFHSGLLETDEADFVTKGLVGQSVKRLFSQQNNNGPAFGIRVRPGLSMANQEGSDFLVPEREPKSVVYSLVSYESWFTAGRFTAAWGWRHDRFYDRDPDGLDTAHRWAIRPENAYLSYQSP